MFVGSLLPLMGYLNLLKALKKKVLHLVFRIFLVSGIFDIPAAIENKKKTLKIYSASSECMFCPTFQKKKKKLKGKQNKNKIILSTLLLSMHHYHMIVQTGKLDVRKKPPKPVQLLH